MKRWIVLWALGAVLLVVGGVLWFVPVVPDGPHTVTPPVLETSQRWYWVEDNVTGFSVTGTVPFSLEWSSSAELYLDYAICPSPQSDFTDFFNSSFRIHGCSEFYGLQGSSSEYPGGALSAGVPSGGSVVLAWALETYGPHNVSITYTFWTGLTVAGLALLILGPISIGLGVIALMRARRRQAEEWTSSPTRASAPSSPPSPEKPP
jgi:hypothetical protein